MDWFPTGLGLLVSDVSLRPSANEWKRVVKQSSTASVLAGYRGAWLGRPVRSTWSWTVRWRPAGRASALRSSTVGVARSCCEAPRRGAAPTSASASAAASATVSASVSATASADGRRWQPDAGAWQCASRWRRPCWRPALPLTWTTWPTWPVFASWPPPPLAPLRNLRWPRRRPRHPAVQSWLFWSAHRSSWPSRGAAPPARHPIRLFQERRYCDAPRRHPTDWPHRRDVCANDSTADSMTAATGTRQWEPTVTSSSADDDERDVARGAADRGARADAVLNAVRDAERDVEADAALPMWPRAALLLALVTLVASANPPRRLPGPYACALYAEPCGVGSRLSESPRRLQDEWPSSGLPTRQSFRQPSAKGRQKKNETKRNSTMTMNAIPLPLALRPALTKQSLRDKLWRIELRQPGPRVRKYA